MEIYEALLKLRGNAKFQNELATLIYKRLKGEITESEFDEKEKALIADFTKEKKE